MHNLNHILCQKQILRGYYKNKRLEISEEQKANMDNSIYNKLINFSSYIKSDKVFIYASKQGEVDTWKILSHCWNNGKEVAVPKCKTGKGDMDFYVINSAKDVEPGICGIYEPIISKCKLAEDFYNSLCVVPGLCFDQYGYRIGYGKGYYDRFLKNFNNIKIGLCYSSCILDTVPHNDFDQLVDVLITDKHIKIIN